MNLNRRNLLALGALGSAAASFSSPAAAELAPVEKAAKPLHILILGGTGFTGPNQVRYALARGHKITLFNRGRKEFAWPGEVEELTGDRETGDLASLKGRKFDVCIDNPTSVPFWVRDAANVLAKNVQHYIFISTISVYRDNSIPNMDESGALHSYEGKDVMAETRATLMANMALYGPLKAECEREAQKRFAKKCTVIRPGLIVGPGDETDRFSYWPLRMEKGGTVLAPPAADPVQFIDCRDLAEWTIRIAEQRALGVFNATGPDYPLTVDAMLYSARAATTAGANIRFTDADFLEKQQVAPWAELPVWVPGSGETGGLARTNIDKAKAAGLRFRSLSDTIDATLAWFHSQPEERQKTIRAGIKADKEAAVLKKLG